jgi:superfamily II DNA helicase RecQ
MNDTPLSVLNTVFGYAQFRGHQLAAIEQAVMPWY